jgi:hypothetical protein
MHIYIFKSETRKELRAFAGDPMGSKLPQNHGPWTVTGVVGPHKAPPHNFSRNVIGRSNRRRRISTLASGQKDGSQNLIRPMIENLLHVPLLNSPPQRLVKRNTVTI